MEKKLEFINPRLDGTGEIITVRLGRKWMDYFLQGNRSVTLTDGTTGVALGEAELLDARMVTFNCIPQSWLSKEQDSSCRTTSALYDCMKRAYGEAFSSNSDVTVLFFKLKHESWFDKLKSLWRSL